MQAIRLNVVVSVLPLLILAYDTDKFRENYVDISVIFDSKTHQNHPINSPVNRFCAKSEDLQGPPLSAFS